MTQLAQPKPAISPAMILPFVKAVRDVFLKMANTETTVGKPFLKDNAKATYEVCGIIGFSGEITGSVTVCFSDTAALKLVEAFAGMAIERTSSDFADAIGELANMIAGSAKHQLGGAASISTPSVVIGHGYSISGLSKIPCIVIPCSSPFGAFAVEVCIQQKQTA